MKRYCIILGSLALALAAIGLAQPSLGLAATSATLSPESVSNYKNYGVTYGDIASLAALDQTGVQDDPANYVSLQTPGKKAYLADYSFSLPGAISRSAVLSLQIQADYRGPVYKRQTWVWLLYNWRTRRWMKIGTNASVASATTWTPLTFNVASKTPADYFNASSSQVLVRLQSSNYKYDASLDYLALVITSPDAPPPVTATPPVTGTPPASGCSLFPANNVWNARVDSLPVDTNSSQYVSALGASTGLHPDFGSAMWDGGPIGIPFNFVSGSQPKVGVTFDYADESDPGPYPIPTTPNIEYGSDHHLLTVDTTNCVLYELYAASKDSQGNWSAGSGAIWDLTSNAMRTDGWTSADAAGLPILPGLARYGEVAAGQINHALRFTAADIRDSTIWPASHHATCGGHSATDTSVPPMGQRFRLKASFNISGYSTQTQVILTALKQYGMILADCGSDWYLSGAPDPGWNDDALVSELRTVPGSDFEAVNESSLHVAANSYATTP